MEITNKPEQDTTLQISFYIFKIPLTIYILSPCELYDHTSSNFPHGSRITRVFSTVSSEKPVFFTHYLKVSNFLHKMITHLIFHEQFVINCREGPIRQLPIINKIENVTSCLSICLYFYIMNI